MSATWTESDTTGKGIYVFPNGNEYLPHLSTAIRKKHSVGCDLKNRGTMENGPMTWKRDMVFWPIKMASAMKGLNSFFPSTDKCGKKNETAFI